MSCAKWKKEWNDEAVELFLETLEFKYCPYCGAEINEKGCTKENIPYKWIINYLNETLGKRYNHKTKKYRKLIRARWNEGFRIEDFKKVVDIKKKEWLGNIEMEKYLRPQTLFNNKMDWYLNQAIKGETKEKDFSNVKKYMNRRSL